MGIVGVMIFAVMAAITATLIKGNKNSFDVYIAVAACLIILGFIYTRLKGVIEKLTDLTDYINLDEGYLEILLKIVGISYLAQFSSDICKECGYSTIANQIQIFGKVTVMLISMPVIMALVQTVEYLLGG